MIPLHDDNPTEITPLVTVSLILLSVAVFFWQLSLGPQVEKIVYALGAIPADLFDLKERPPEIQLVPDWVTAFTSMFLHGGWAHLLGNMLYLWIFGNNVEDAMGHLRFLVFYLLCGIIAMLTHALLNPASTLPMIGASGAISGVLGAYLLLYPHARILVLIPLGFLLYTVYLPAGYVLVFWFVLQLINSALLPNEGGGVAWGAHIGGFIAGMVLIPLFRRRGMRLFHPRRHR